MIDVLFIGELITGKLPGRDEVSREQYRVYSGQ